MRKINVIAMAGSGQRFLDQNYITPKPLIIIKRKPMFYYAAKSLPLSKKIIFICKKQLNFIHKLKFFIKKFLQWPLKKGNKNSFSDNSNFLSLLKPKLPQLDSYVLFLKNQL